MAAHRGAASLRPRYTRGGSSVAAILVYHSTIFIGELMRSVFPVGFLSSLLYDVSVRSDEVLCL
jgi:hypothetical protein